MPGPQSEQSKGPGNNIPLVPSWMEESPAVLAEREACAALCDAFAAIALKATHETKDKDAANAFRGQRVAAANLAGQIRNRST